MGFSSTLPGIGSRMAAQPATDGQMTSSRGASPWPMRAMNCTAATALLPSVAPNDSDGGMCGISVLVDINGSPRLKQRLLAMHAVIRHRGPDGEGFLLLDAQGSVTRAQTPEQLHAAARPHVGIAFRRLKICDLSEAAAQPMGSADGRCWIAFNGEIYNFRELRDELAAKGRIFRTTGDTEVALAAYEEWGE